MKRAREPERGGEAALERHCPLVVLDRLVVPAHERAEPAEVVGDGVIRDGAVPHRPVARRQEPRVQLLGNACLAELERDVRP